MDHPAKKYNLKVILVEGPDCSGKSTVVERLKNMLHWDSKALQHQEGNQFQRYLREYAHADKVIFDRGHFSEEVYSLLWRKGSPFSVQEKDILAALCQQMMLIIFVCPPVEIMKRRYRQRLFQQQIKFGELEPSRILFCEVMRTIPHIVYTSQNYEELDLLLNRIKEVMPNKTLCPASGTSL